MKWVYCPSDDNRAQFNTPVTIQEASLQILHGNSRTARIRTWSPMKLFAHTYHRWEYTLLANASPSDAAAMYKGLSVNPTGQVGVCMYILVPGQSTLHFQGTARGSVRPSQPR
ncbi:hypothetical protein COCVIDRAFT_13365 [Bipolaris victoriae FI3]|uniref:Uncharacterized protein n=1 Tax=Bipolaris victoriae (strain FI3) TaxID=930091 RepID=W7F1V5_BIPV3|nr:hypothetical protein COCVIDRAFT_13365 [Bipolaris victoriae FI3]